MTKPARPKRPRKTRKQMREHPQPQGRPTVPEQPDAEEKLKLICQALRQGNQIEIAAQLAGTSQRAIRECVDRARREPDGVHARWAKAIMQALAVSEVSDLAVIDRAAQGSPAVYKQIAQTDSKGDPIYDADGRPIMVVQLDGKGQPIVLRAEVTPTWTAAAWKLERRAPKRWGRYDRLHIDDLGDLMNPPERQTEEERVDRGEVQARAERLVRVKRLLEAVPVDSDLGEV